MNKRMTGRELCATAWDLLREHLGPADGMRFFSLIRNPGRHYQTWREGHFRNLTPDQLIDRMRRTKP